jgi:hypothetical protein
VKSITYIGCGPTEVTVLTSLGYGQPTEVRHFYFIKNIKNDTDVINRNHRQFKHKTLISEFKYKRWKFTTHSYIT